MKVRDIISLMDYNLESKTSIEIITDNSQLIFADRAIELMLLLDGRESYVNFNGDMEDARILDREIKELAFNLPSERDEEKYVDVCMTVKG